MTALLVMFRCYRGNSSTFIVERAFVKKSLNWRLKTAMNQSALNCLVSITSSQISQIQIQVASKSSKTFLLTTFFIHVCLAFFAMLSDLLSLKLEIMYSFFVLIQRKIKTCVGIRLFDDRKSHPSNMTHSKCNQISAHIIVILKNKNHLPLTSIALFGPHRLSSR